MALASLRPQIGIPKRMTVIDLSFQKNPEEKIALINPEVVTKEGKIYEEEGCLSLPDIREKVARAARVKIRAQDLEGNWFEREADELLARAFQHEIDHLDGGALHLPHQRPQARFRPAQDPQTADEPGNGSVKLVFCGTPQFRRSRRWSNSLASRHSVENW